MPNIKVIISLREVGGAQLLHEYNQGNDDRLNQSDLTQDGWCLSVSTHWIRFKRFGGNFWKWLEGNHAPSAFRFQMASQSVRYAFYSHGGDSTSPATFERDVDDKAMFILKKAGMNRVGHHEYFNANATLNNMVIGIHQPGKYCRIGFSYQGGGGHSVAAMLESKDILFMDPNVGEMKFTSKDQFSRWLPKFWKAMNYANLTYLEVGKYN